ncbi:hypothetical protein HanRHA438_Chr07g0296681 [Helianthus annuus]|uniref:Uncharacterized protein n=1 Tax=Helianthus annuus TaxID=4232 RepID=A0A251UAW6_HELAN|nr:hypothetical protein HanXRQr2_Chr07g0286061 [Helianthus annuus]KAJ0549562.1 hypothetical protein HanHA300_Chr07g0235201 [Helianthus annuus]KAJ0555984.1 hypothetical protein HanIR_Chr07g0308501 [Helianthus annuus]KAJ0562518.1 hypothetical protein HanHA89_Chr07g0252391 [Helianthus annuus]KAJ0727894.1 hypothetical protein HanLR1_Chr07g0235161 [Helianthus annuus]
MREKKGVGWRPRAVVRWSPENRGSASLGGEEKGGGGVDQKWWCGGRRKIMVAANSLRGEERWEWSCCFVFF